MLLRFICLLDWKGDQIKVKNGSPIKHWSCSIRRMTQLSMGERVICTPLLIIMK